MGPKTKTNTYEFTEFSLVLTLSLPRNQSEWYLLGHRVHLLTFFENGISVLVSVRY